MACKKLMLSHLDSDLLSVMCEICQVDADKIYWTEEADSISF